MKQAETIPQTVEEKGSNTPPAATGFLSNNYARLVNLFGYGLWSDEPGPLTLETAITISAVVACMDVISQDIAKVPLRLRRRLRNGGSEIVHPDEHGLARMLALEPNEHHTWREFHEMVVLHLAAVQNAFIGKRFNRRGEIDGLFPFLPGRIRILVDKSTNNYVYDVDRLTPHEELLYRDFERYLLPAEVIHIRGRMFDGLWGYSNLDAGSGVMNMSKALQDYQTNLYRSDATLRGVFQMKNEETLSEEAFQRLKEQLTELWNKVKREGRPIVLEEGMEFKAISMNADAAEAAKAKHSAVEDVTRLFRMPPHKISHIVNVKYENMETLDRSYVQDTLDPVATRVERKLERALLKEEERLEYFLEYDREAMMLFDAEKQAEITKVLMDRGAMTINEARMKRGMNPLPPEVGDVRLVPANFNLVDASGDLVLSANQQAGNNSDPGGNENNDQKAIAPQITPELRIVE